MPYKAAPANTAAPFIPKSGNGNKKENYLKDDIEI
jgi:hypothetical protein